MKNGMFKKLTAVAIMTVFIAGSGAAIAKTGGFAFETSGMKISLDLRSPTGVKLLFQRAD